MGGNAGIQTRGCWVRSKYGTSVPCSPQITPFSFKSKVVLKGSHYQIIRCVAALGFKVDPGAVEGQRLVAGVDADRDWPVLSDGHLQRVAGARSHVDVILKKYGNCNILFSWS